MAPIDFAEHVIEKRQHHIHYDALIIVGSIVLVTLIVCGVLFVPWHVRSRDKRRQKKREARMNQAQASVTDSFSESSASASDLELGTLAGTIPESRGRPRSRSPHVPPEMTQSASVSLKPANMSMKIEDSDSFVLPYPRSERSRTSLVAGSEVLYRVSSWLTDRSKMSKSAKPGSLVAGGKDHDSQQHRRSQSNMGFGATLENRAACSASTRRQST